MARVEQVDLPRAEWLIASGKSRAARRVLDLTPESVGIMEKRCMAAGAEGFLFNGRRRGTPLSDIENGHKRVLEASGRAFVIYDLRHTFATRFAEATGGDVVALAAILGHANLRTVMRYVHVSREHRRAQMSRLVGWGFQSAPRGERCRFALFAVPTTGTRFPPHPPHPSSNDGNYSRPNPPDAPPVHESLGCDAYSAASLHASSRSTG